MKDKPTNLPSISEIMKSAIYTCVFIAFLLVLTAEAFAPATPSQPTTTRTPRTALSATRRSFVTAAAAAAFTFVSPAFALDDISMPTEEESKKMSEEVGVSRVLNHSFVSCIILLFTKSCSRACTDERISQCMDHPRFTRLFRRSSTVSFPYVWHLQPSGKTTFALSLSPFLLVSESFLYPNTATFVVFGLMPVLPEYCFFQMNAILTNLTLFVATCTHTHTGSHETSSREEGRIAKEGCTTSYLSG